MSVVALPWDTSFFGVAIGRSSASTPIAMVAAEARSMSLACVYIEAEDEVSPEDYDLRLVDRRVLLRAAANTTNAQDTSIRLANDADRPRFDPILDRLAPWSRFARDENFGLDAARRMYAAWLDRALSSPDEVVGTTESASAFVTVSTTDIGLIGASLDGTGAGSALIAWAKQQVPATLDVVTQADNARALALYESHGFARVTETLMYHLWV